MNGMKPVRLTSITGTVAVAIGAAILSFDHISKLAERHGYSHTGSIILPIITDAMMIVATIATLDGRKHTGFARFALALGVVVSCGINVLGAPRDPVSMGLAMLPAAWLFMTVHMLAKAGMKATRKPSTRKPSPLSVRVPKTQMRYPSWDAKRIAQSLGCTEATAKRYMVTVGSHD